MSHLLDAYKRYKSLLLQLEAALNELDELTHNQKFFETQRILFHEYKNCYMKCFGLPMQLEGLENNLKQLNSKLEGKNIELSEREKLLASRHELNEKIDSLKKEIAYYEKKKPEITGQIPWRLELAQLTTKYLREQGANPEQLHAFTRRYHAYSQLKKELDQALQDLNKAFDDAASNEREEAIAWRITNVTPLSKKLIEIEKKPQYADGFILSLCDKYTKTCMQHASYLNKPGLTEKVQQGKIPLHQLEDLVAIRKQKQEHYRALLPDYVAVEIFDSIHIKGKRTLGVLKTNTEDKIKAINAFLDTPFQTANEEQDKKKLKQLFAYINVSFDSAKITEIYQKAKEKQRSAEVDQIFSKINEL
ncbi:Uncharacterised protein [Legionella wadsworthii]|uniref:Uncharacterized protein n=1 Tax=Legionella wadsworthii TaxID=28088 RepID=A0A378LMT7_9GAMM|nr:hypothetical protein [Legionella wadsworthii]STY28325.1 Uncharacterised protein [Legionella wadsworthii]